MNRLFLSIDTHFTQLVCKTSEKSRDEDDGDEEHPNQGMNDIDGQQFLGWAHGSKKMGEAVPSN
jgi:hypothetical protein